MANTVYIRCEASQTRGFGHLRRCLVLANALKRGATTPVFIQPENDIQANELIHKNGHEIYIIPDNLSYRDEAGHYPNGAHNILLDLIHHDILNNKKEFTSYVQYLKNSNWTIALIDGLFEESFRSDAMPDVDCIIQPYVGAEQDERPKCASWLAGGQYAILDEAYKAAPKKVIKADVNNILVTFGGSDPQGNTPIVMESLLYLPDNIEIRVVIGPYFSSDHRTRICALQREHQNKFVLIENEFNLIPHYLWADLAIGGSGTSRYEFAATGLPAIFTSIYPFHERLSQLFHDTGIALYLGPYNALSADDWKNGANELINNKDLRQRLSMQSYKIIDSQGTDRIVSHLNKSTFWSGS